MIDVNYKGIICALGIATLFVIMIVMMVVSAGCITAAKEIAKDAMATPTPTPSLPPTPTPSPPPTPRPTPVSLPTIMQKPVDPFIHGERFEGQWFKWHRPGLQGNLTLDAGIIVYRHAWLNNYTWYNSFTGNYQRQEPTEGMRYFVVWIHQEVFGTDAHTNTGMYPFYETSYAIQVKDQLIYNDSTHNVINRILELDPKLDYYNVVTAKPFGWSIRYTGKLGDYGGYTASRIGEIHLGKYNNVDGYILFEVPEKTMIEDVALLGNFERFGSAYWRFND